MSRVIAFVACGLILAGCASSGDLFKSTPSTITMQFESKPAGAEAKTSLGESCRTPCALPMAPDKEFSVTFTLAGYQPQTVAVEVGLPEDLPPPESGEPRLLPNPVSVELVKTKPVPKRAPAAAKKPAAAKPASAAAPAPAAAAPWPPIR